MATWLVRRSPTGTSIEVRHRVRGKPFPTGITFPPRTPLRAVVAGVLDIQKLSCTQDIIVVPGGCQLWPPRYRSYSGGGEGAGIPNDLLRLVAHEAP